MGFSLRVVTILSESISIFETFLDNFQRQRVRAEAWFTVRKNPIREQQSGTPKGTGSAVYCPQESHMGTTAATGGEGAGEVPGPDQRGVTSMIR